MDDFNERIAQAKLLGSLLERVGFAFWQLAECEYAVATYLVIKLKATQGMGVGAGEELLAEARKRTFGSLVGELRESRTLEPSTQQRLDNLVHERNWLAHRAKRESRGVIFDDPSYRKLAARLESISDETYAPQGIVADELGTYVLSKGADPTRVEQEFIRIASSWGYMGEQRTV